MIVWSESIETILTEDDWFKYNSVVCTALVHTLTFSHNALIWLLHAPQCAVCVWITRRNQRRNKWNRLHFDWDSNLNSLNLLNETHRNQTLSIYGNPNLNDSARPLCTDMIEVESKFWKMASNTIHSSRRINFLSIGIEMIKKTLKFIQIFAELNRLNLLCLIYWLWSVLCCPFGVRKQKERSYRYSFAGWHRSDSYTRSVYLLFLLRFFAVVISPSAWTENMHDTYDCVHAFAFEWLYTLRLSPRLRMRL